MKLEAADSVFSDGIEGGAYLIDSFEIATFLPKLARDQNKYDAGYLLAVAGSAGMEGAAILATSSALRCGCGIVRLFHPPEIEGHLHRAAIELICASINADNMESFTSELARADALLIGPGMGRSQDTALLVKRVLEQTTVPMVIDADALYHLPVGTILKNSVLTPHRGEMKRLLQKADASTFLQQCNDFAQDRQCTLVLKGYPTYIFHPGQKVIVMPHGDPGMATAGTGDLLTGAIGALLASGIEAHKAAIIGVYIHARAGEFAAAKYGSRGMIASDMLKLLPRALLKLEFPFITP